MSRSTPSLRVCEVRDSSADDEALWQARRLLGHEREDRVCVLEGLRLGGCARVLSVVGYLLRDNVQEILGDSEVARSRDSREAR